MIGNISYVDDNSKKELDILVDQLNTAIGKLPPKSSAIELPTTPVAANLFTKAFKSAEITPATSTTFLVEHGFGVQPELVQVVMRCKIAQFGFSVNDEAIPMTDAASNTGVYSNATNIGFVIGTTVHVHRPDTQATANITLANWVIVMRAWA
jgi:hypothetical protein